ncbi:hypothetical protein LOZ39_004338 [Ophidiomyces ophidiicola]|uniref:Uncharacterized protein n=1 Tax=Ophidiomyces ophidiicola TaxID=1387563 RepID=A0ACB8UU23_9EURO|nr:hypothetical protein LOZ62_002189 [Ophidiomyces ophidiicola]KAI1968004.1 hypothetical protein LOZ56_005238 [Ophidiomyces ophidiicola]KAI2004105.1 hypothetical protein LOZ50_004442 [Ophidiomyces ophidiicola]KAI2023032.1 hypothetical protein LOZ45_004115 [Ophidiomyces ophidiicola]KAI2046074.1 hypothetical protein LOZ38_005553 [Ophidiomyces ophidiicola]
MFRRKRSVSHGPINPNPSPSAQTAAVQAFRASQAANANAKLSSSAAAAALRKHTPTPTSVEDVQTKRMLHRQQSVSSIGSPRGRVQHSQDLPLRRASSLGLMSKRTFRDASPGRTSPLALGSMGPKDEIDPVPPLPKVYVAAAATAHRRSVSGGPPVRRTISPQNRASGPLRTGERQLRQSYSQSLGSVQGSPVPALSSLQRRNSRSSINFSYPINAHPNSPRQSSVKNFATDTPSIRTLSPVEPVALDLKPLPYISKMEPVAEPIDQKSVDVPKQKIKQNTPKQHANNPSIKYEIAQDNEIYRERGLTAESPIANGLDSTKQLLAHSPNRNKSSVGEEHHTEQSSKIPFCASDEFECNRTHKLAEQSASSRDRMLHEQGVQRYQESPILTPSSPSHSFLRRIPPDPAKDRSGDHTPTERPPSLSPTRSTRFSERLEIVFPGDHLHEPPPRSKSPAKSALKPTASSHNVTPDRLTTTQHLKAADAPSESDATSVVSDEGSKLSWKKKPIKVSFGDEAEVAGTVASPPTSPDSIVPSSPQQTWNGSLRGKCDYLDDFEEVLKPRPALPSFGSIRGRRRFEEDEEGELTVRPENSRPSLADSVFSESFSNDFAIGGLLAKSGEQRHKSANVPLSPEVGSVDGTGVDSISLTESSSDDADPNEFILPGRSISGTPVALDTGPYSQQPTADERANQEIPKRANLVVPVIAIQPATPMHEEHPKSISGQDDIPGAFPAAGDQEKKLEETVHRDNETDDPASDSGDSVYSDAAEDLPDIEGDGFGSINAIVSDHLPVIAPLSGEPNVVQTALAENSIPVTLEPSVETPSFKELPGAPKSPTGPKKQMLVEPDRRIEQNEQPPKTARPALTQMPRSRLNGSPQKSRVDVETSQEHFAEQQPGLNTYHAVSTVKHLDGQLSPTTTNGRDIPSFSPVPSPKKQKPADGHNATGNNFNRQRLQRIPSNGSDSSSSFKRERRSPKNIGVYTLRRTMRNGPGPLKPEPSEERRHTYLSISSSQHHRPFSSGDGHGVLRTTLRTPDSTSRRKSTSSPFTSLRNPRFKPRSPGSPKELGSGFKSRFEDSSDDEYELQTFTPVRGIPRRKDEVDGDSTALEDSSDSDSPRKTVRKTRSISKGTDMPSIAAAIAKKKSEQMLSKAGNGGLNSPMASPPATQRKQKKSVLSRLHLSRRHFSDETRVRKSAAESPARRDTVLERSEKELENIRNTKLYQKEPGISESHGMDGLTSKGKWPRFSAQSSRPTKKLSRQPSAAGKISWPLPSPEDGSQHTRGLSLHVGPSSLTNADPHSKNEVSRPHTSNGVSPGPSLVPPANMPSNLDSQWSSRLLHHRDNHSDPGSMLRTDALEGTTKKKSRFSKLRKAFGMS